MAQVFLSYDAPTTLSIPRKIRAEYVTSETHTWVALDEP